MEQPELIKNTVLEALGCEIIELDKDRVIITMPISNAARQPFGLLHGGVSVVLSESCASIGTWLNIDQHTQAAVGIEINANHVRAKRDGTVTATAIPMHKGRTTMVWETRITDERKQLICISRCTVAIVHQPKSQ